MRRVSISTRSADSSGRNWGNGRKRPSCLCEGSRRGTSIRSPFLSLSPPPPHLMCSPTHSDRNWLTFTSYLDATFALFTTSSTSELTAAQSLFTEVALADGKSERGAHLALLELEKRLRSTPSLSSSEIEGRKSLKELIEAYFGTFGNKAACVEDLVPYVSASELREEERKAVVTLFESNRSDVSHSVLFCSCILSYWLSTIGNADFQILALPCMVI